MIIHTHSDSRQLALALGLFLVAALVFLLLTPPLDGPDAPAHLKYAAFLAEGGGLVTLQEAVEVSHEVVQQPPLYYGLAALLDRGGFMAQALSYTVTNPYIVDCVGLKTTVLLPDIPLSARLGFLIPRLLSLLGGLLTVSGLWFWLSRALPQKEGHPSPVALTAALLLGLTPMFAFQSTAVNNDILTVGLAMWAVVAGMAAYRNHRWWQWLAAGALTGAGSLCKYSGLLAAVPLGVIWIWHAAETRSWKSLKPALLMVAGFAAVAGWWFVRNMVLYGELVPMDALLPLLPGLSRSGNLSLGEILALWNKVWKSFFGVYACGISAPEWLVWGWALLARIGEGAVLLAALRGLNRRQWVVVSSAAAWYITSLLMMLLWANSLQYTGQGRLLFIAAPAQFALAAIGWQALIDTSKLRWRLLLIAWLIVSAGITAIQLHNVYGPVQTLSAVEADRPVEATLDNGVRIEGIDLPDGAALTTPGSLPVRVYVSAEQPLDTFYTLYVQLVLADDRRIATWSGLAAGGRLTSIEWPAGEIIPLDLTLTVDEPLDELATLVVGAYPAGDPAESQGLRVASIRLLDAASAQTRPPDGPSLATWDNGIVLQTATPRLAEDGTLLGAALQWSTTEIMSTDYTVSLQALDADGRLITQTDQQPQQGQYPTSTWMPGCTVSDTILFAAPSPEWQQLVVLLYDGQGQRLVVNDSDYMVIAER